MFVSRILFSAIGLVLFLFSPLAFTNALRTPPCDELVAWSNTVDADKRWAPFAENQKLWVPTAMLAPEFQSLFGKAALDWSGQDVGAAKKHWSACMKHARKARDKEEFETLSTGRGYVIKNLRNVIRQQARRGQRVTMAQYHAAMQKQAEPKIKPPQVASSPQLKKPAAPTAAPGVRAGVDELLSAPPSFETLFVLGVMSQLDTNDSDGLQKLEKEIGHMTNKPAISAGYRIMRELRIRGDEGFESQRARINTRLAEIKPGVMEELKADYSKNPANLTERRRLATRYEKQMKLLERALTQEEYQALADEARKARRVVVDKAVLEAKSRIDQVQPGYDSIETINQIVSKTEQRGLDLLQRRELQEYARTRQRVLADQVLVEAREKELPALPNTMAGLRQLNAIGTRIARGVAQKASPDVVKQFLEASEARLATIGRKALPEYRKKLAQVPESKSGLAQVKKEVATNKHWVDMREDVRADYVEAAESREAAIAKVVEKERKKRLATEQKEQERAIAAGGDPRFIHSEWIDENRTMKLEFRDEETVFVTTFGMKFAGTYKVSRDDVVVKGPHGQLVFTLNGEKLSGMGAVFRRKGS